MPTKVVKMMRRPGPPPVVPNYRFVCMIDSSFHVYRKHYQHVTASLPGFRLETCMTCTMKSVLELASPAATQFESGLSADVLPTLRDERNLVLSIYMRSGHTDEVTKVEKQGTDKVAEPTDAARTLVQKSLPCVEQVEQQYLANSNTDAIDRFVWLVISDSPVTKQMIAQNYWSSSLTTANDIRGSTRMLPCQIINHDINPRCPYPYISPPIDC